MYKVGRLCVKLAGRDAGKKCVIVDVLKDNYVMIDGSTRRRKCNITHLEPLNKVIKIKKKATHAEIAKAFKKLKLPINSTKPKKTTSKPKKVRKTVKSEEPVKKEIKKSKKTKKKSENKPTKKKTPKKKK